MSFFRFNRRRFLLAAGIGAGSGLFLGALGAAGYLALRKSVRVGLIGAGSRGRYLAARVGYTKFLPISGQLVAIADVDRTHAEKARHRHAPKADIYGDYKDLLAREDIDAVIIATPDHWHIGPAIQSLRAGKAVYCEKPLSLTIAEGRRLVNVVKETGGLLMVGTQQRSDARFQLACELIQNGRLGQLRKIKISLPVRKVPGAKSAWDNDGPFPAERPPKHLDWEMWLGQAPYVDYCKQRCDVFRRWYEYSGGLMTDWGSHHLDIVHWALGDERAYPLSVDGDGEMPRTRGGFNTPVKFRVHIQYPQDVSVHIEPIDGVDGNGITFEGDRGKLFVNRKRIEGSAVKDLDAGLSFGRLLDQRGLSDAVRIHSHRGRFSGVNTHHIYHFLKCAVTGQRPVADVVSGHRAATVCHLGNISMRLGRKIRWDHQNEKCAGDAEANEMLQRPQRQPYAIA